MRELRASRKKPGADRIYTAGEKEYLFHEETKGRGVLLNESIRKDLVTMRNELGINEIDLGF